jgi:hypothetical protein
LDHLRSTLEQIKWGFPRGEPNFPAYGDFSQIAWLPKLMAVARRLCSWIGSKSVFVFVDDYTTPRISLPMQLTLNRLLFQRSSDFVCKVATESFTTFVAQDDTGKVLQDGDDYQLIDMGEESLFMSEEERSWFLNEIFRRRLALDPRIPSSGQTLEGLLGTLGMKKLEFARRLRAASAEEFIELGEFPRSRSGASSRRGKTQARVLYYGCEVFSALWSGDTRTMIQLVQELVDSSAVLGKITIDTPIDAELQDRVFRNRGGQWLESQIRNQPTDRVAYSKGLKELKKQTVDFQFSGGSYGSHLKAVVEAFVKIARDLLLSPMYRMANGREVPRMAFRIEVTDEFRVHGLAAEIYKDLIRYGMFMRDARGKSVRGAFVPRLYLRRLLLPYSTLALSKRDSVQMNCDSFNRLLLTPDVFAVEFTRYKRFAQDDGQSSLPFE